jgi:tetratricopeptide (TPR) repeat protein
VTRGTAAAAATLCLAGSVALHAAADRWFPPPSQDYQALLYVRSPETMRRLALEYTGVAADLYWIRALQHFGRERLAPPEHVRTYALLYPLLDVTTTLDPLFSIAYRFGAIFLGEPYPGGPARPDLAIALLKKGLSYQPQKWQFMQDLGFVYYWHLQDYTSAADWFQRASEQPGAPNWLRPLAAVTLTEGGQRGSARELWQHISQAEEAWLRDAAEHRLAQLDALDEMDRIKPYIDAYARAFPGQPITWDRLIAARVLRGVPVDPSGTPFDIDPSTGQLSVSVHSKLFPMPGQKPLGPARGGPSEGPR